jgi:hypothetical protein
VLRYVLGDHRPGADEGVAADGMAADDGAVGPQGGAFLDEGGADLVHLPDFRPGVVDIGEYHRGAAEDAVFQGDAFIDADVVLDLALVADSGVGADDDVLADVAGFADPGAGEDVGEVPDFGAFTDGDVVVDDGGFVGEVVIITGKNRDSAPFSLDSGFRRNDGRGSRNDGRGAFLLLDGALAEFENFQDAEAFFAGG